MAADARLDRQGSPAAPGESVAAGEGAAVRHLEAEIAARAEPFRRTREQVGRVVVGQRALVDRMLVCLLANGHLLIEGPPGLAKTTAVTALAGAVRLSFRRLQFTPDLLPGDLVGTQIYDPRNLTFEVRKGPIFANLVLADEVNRAPAKVQSALLEAMQDRQVTLGGETFPLPKPFVVMATQNPIEQEGTYPLPEAQLDRFMLKVEVGFPGREEELEILDRMARTDAHVEVEPVLSPGDILEARELVDRVVVSRPVRGYVVDLVMATRDPYGYGIDIGSLIEHAASSRATIGLTLAAKATAFLAGRSYVTPQDVKAVAADVLRHRILLSYEAEADGVTAGEIVRRLLDHVPVP